MKNAFKIDFFLLLELKRANQTLTLWYGTEEKLIRFIEHCNTSHEIIKFTFSYDYKTRAVDFLDIHIWIDHEGWIQTDLYQKAGKKCQL